jgi:thiamine-monophosphate kinase
MGEFELLARFRERLPADGPRVKLGSGDDAAVTEPGGATATSVDAIVDGVHFRRDEAALTTIGRKALASALSDLAAMGAEAGEAYVVLGAPADLGEEGLIALLDGMLELATETGTTIAGGDLTASPSLTLAVTVVGHAASAEQMIGRGGAQPGDLLVLTGEIGGAAAGRLLLDDPALGAGLPKEIVERLRKRQLDPAPRLRSGRALALVGARAMIDLSDGLAGDAAHLAEASHCAVKLDAAALPLEQGVAEVALAAERDPLQLAASGGEDYELLAALPPDRLADAANGVGAAAETSLTPVGEVAAGAGVEIRLPGGGLLQTRSFDHLAGRQREIRSGAHGYRGD